MPKVFIIILNWNGYEDTKECIESLQDLDYPDFKIVVIDNGSADASMDFIPRKYPNIAFIETKANLGFAGGNDIGIDYSLANGADYVLLLNNDTTVEPNFLRKLMEVSEGDKKIGIVGPLILYYGDRERVWFAGGKFNWLKTRGMHPKRGKLLDKQSLLSNKTVDYITGCCLLIKRDVIKKIGPLSRDYFLYYEDGDWCLEAKKAGWKSFFVPSARIYHKCSKSAVELSYPYLYYHARNGLILCSRFRSRVLAYLVSFWIYFKQIIKMASGYKKEWARPIMRGVRDFWRGKRGKLEGYY